MQHVLQRYFNSVCFLLQHPFCCRGYTRAVIQDLLDLYKRKSDKKGHVGEPDDDDDDDTAQVDEVKATAH